MFARCLSIAAVAMCAASPAVIAAGDASRSTYVDDAGRFQIGLPDGCREMKAAGNTPRFIACGKAFVRAGFTPGGTDVAALQRTVDVYTGGFSNFKLLQNGAGGTLGGEPIGRGILAEGTNRGQLADLQILAVAKDGGWYALVFGAPAVDYVDDAAQYFAWIKTHFHFTHPAALPSKRR